MVRLTFMSVTMACLCLSILASPAWGMKPEKRLNSSNSHGRPAHIQRRPITCLIWSWRCLLWSPGMLVAWTMSPYRSTFFCPFTDSPSLATQAGLGRQRLLAEASENSALERVESAPDLARSQDVESLSLWRQAHAGLSLLGLWLSKALARRRARVFSLAVTTRANLKVLCCYYKI